MKHKHPACAQVTCDQLNNLNDDQHEHQQIRTKEEQLSTSVAVQNVNTTMRLNVSQQQQTTSSAAQTQHLHPHNRPPIEHQHLSNHQQRPTSIVVHGRSHSASLGQTSTFSGTSGGAQVIQHARVNSAGVVPSSSRVQIRSDNSVIGTNSVNNNCVFNNRVQVNGKDYVPPLTGGRPPVIPPTRK